MNLRILFISNAADGGSTETPEKIINRLTAANAELQGQLTALTTENAGLREQVTTLTAKNAELTEQADALKAREQLAAAEEAKIVEKMARGLTRQQAQAVIKRQRDFDSSKKEGKVS